MCRSALLGTKPSPAQLLPSGTSLSLSLQILPIHLFDALSWLKVPFYHCFLVVVFIILALRSNQWGSSCNSMENKVAKKPQWKYLCHFSAGLISWGFHFLVEEALSDPFSALSDHSLSNLPVISNVCYGDNEFLSPEVWVLRLPEIIWAWPQPLCRQPAPPAPWSTGSPGCVFSSKSKSVEIYQKPQIKGTLRKGEETGISSFCINERMV